ncbi:hypothetical protein CPB86DRAFT_787372, partial [Serendipita vermifera]
SGKLERLGSQARAGSWPGRPGGPIRSSCMTLDQSAMTPLALYDGPKGRA